MSKKQRLSDGGAVTTTTTTTDAASTTRTDAQLDDHVHLTPVVSNTQDAVVTCAATAASSGVSSSATACESAAAMHDGGCSSTTSCGSHGEGTHGTAAAAASSASTALCRTITLNQDETRVFSMLLDVVRTAGLGTTLRAAGGWVRDKILGRQTQDIDIALDNITGAEFAESLVKYVTDHGLRKDVSQIGVVHANPDQSKHLETATMMLFGISLDFVNLRSEVYASDSRIPIGMKLGTPTEDALRRDLTINSMFYNVNTSTLEDLTGQGLADLEKGIIRTPLPPHVTFLDDPLRVLRSIRFASRYGFKIDEELMAAAQERDVQRALQTKISRERIGKEIGLILVGPNMSFGMRKFYELGLYDTILDLPRAATIEDKQYRLHGLTCLVQFDRYMKFLKRRDGEPTGRWEALACLLLPLHSSTFMEKGRPKPTSFHVVLSSLKFSNRDDSEVRRILDTAPLFSRLIHSHPDLAIPRCDTGLIMRKVGTLWKYSLIVALAADLSAGKTLVDSSDAPYTPEEQELINRYNAVVDIIENKLHLVGVWDLKPLVDGSEAAELLHKNRGPWLNQFLQNEIMWQLDNPTATVEDARLWTLQQHV
ncbi:tRNA nucleotidyltransferase [Pelomyxa schiedti]|nr:tRNA nucleotidyltransferase [Pelomyxa schiedti]